MIDRATVRAKVEAAIRSVRDDTPTTLAPDQHLVDDLGFDSAAVATLTIALEEQFDDVLLLNEWIAEASSPSALTIASLVDYLLALLADDA